MSIGVGLVGKKAQRMTRVFTENGTSIPVSVIQVETNRVTQVKTNDTDGYCAIQVTTGTKKAKRVNKSQAGHFKKANVEPGRGMWEFRLTETQTDKFKAGDEVNIDVFKEGQFVDVTAKSIGKGFAGTVKRHNFSMQRATHGNSLSHRAPGSIGQCQTPGRVFKGKKMAGHLGNETTTSMNLEVIRVDIENGVILVKGAIPGAPGSDVIVRNAIKKGDNK